ncbi:SWIM zinc finger family protein [Streptomyces sp. NPDC050535]|uniref:SWIM zinc finger family protein n=1 Tax=Streptomyces sp. NPDC050535 TaxID=3365626 RepID=UPI00379FC290
MPPPADGPSAGAGTDTGTGTGTGIGTEAGGEAGGEVDAGAEVTPTGGPAAGGSRPGDVAREALRAARGATAARQARAGAAGSKRVTSPDSSGVEARRRSTDPTTAPSRAGRNTRDQNRRTQAQDLRDLLAGAFQLPSDADLSDVAPLDAAGSEAAWSDEARPDPASPDAPATDAFALDAGQAARRPGVPAHDQPEAGSSPGAAELDAGAAVPPETWPPSERGTADRRSARSGEASVGLPDASPLPVRGVVADRRPAQPGDASGAHPDSPPPPDRETLPDRAPAQPGDAAGVSSGAPASPARAATPDPYAAQAASPERPAGIATRLPRSMGSPGRDGELRRTFEAFPARASDADGFAETWWGNAWVRSLEEGALDAARLARGRTYAGRGHVDAITVTPGLVLAYVHGSRPRPYRVQVGVGTLSDSDWDRFLDAVAERPGDIAALLDKEMPKSLAECGVALLPGPGELEPHCGCPDFGHPCKHAAALCYQTARLLDEDPFVLLLLRGRGERELLDELSRRNAARIARAAQDQEPAPLPGVRARDALARRVLPPLPAPLPPPAHPEQPPTYPGAPGGPDPFALDQLATDAAARAHAMLTAGRDPVAELTLWQDAVRLAAARPGSGLTATTRTLYASLATAAGRTRADLARAVAAWRQGGFEGLAVLEEPWDPPAGRFDRARPLLLAADLPAFRPWRNHLTHPRGHAQLRLGHSGLWYAYESEPGQDDWWPRGTPDLDPVGALTGLGASGDL